MSITAPTVSLKMWRVELHCHSNYSADSQVTLAEIVAICKKKQLNAIALTDHNTMAGVLRLAKEAPAWLTVIPAEEITTEVGDVIGLWLKREIKPRQSIISTIAEIHRQGGLALLPHPLDRLRHEAVGQRVLDEVAGQVDAVEIFNSRNVFPRDNTLAARYVETNGLTPFVGSDAHTVGEYGRAVMVMEPFKDAAEFSRGLQSATHIKRSSGIGVHVVTKVQKWQKRLRA